MDTMSAPAMASIGDHGVLNQELPPSLAGYWLDRDLGWLDFNDRVLAQALDDRTPLLERAKFLAIFTSNLDEFFMKRVSILREQRTTEGIALLSHIRERLTCSLERQAECSREFTRALAAHGIHLLTWDELTSDQREEAGGYFDSQISPALTPLVFDPAHPFPFLSNLSTSLAFLLLDPQRQTRSYARVKVPGVLKPWLALKAARPAGGSVFVALHEVIRGNIAKLYDGMELTGATLFRLTRDAEVDLEDDSNEAIREVVSEQVRQRRYEPVIRLEFAPGAEPVIRNMLRDRFHLSEWDVFDLPGDLDYTSLFQIADLPVSALRDPAWDPRLPAAFENSPDMFDAIRARDVLVHHPYESFEDSVERFIASAAADPLTVAVKMTAYRVGDDTPFVKSLVKAAEAGKQVACVIEIKARFDEERNLHWAAELERAGAHVTFGVHGLKTHAKMALVVRKEGSGLSCYAHIGTGNYHVRTARFYADVGLFTSNPEICRDAVNLFHYLTGHSRTPACASLMVAPLTMRPRLLELIQRETANQRAGKPARIVAKLNQLEDLQLIAALYEAGEAGVPVDLIVRGFCCLRPGGGRNIRVRSIIGRFLEHSRIFHFAGEAGDPVLGEFYIGSADWMYRNLSKRVEVIAPVRDTAAKSKLWEILDACLRDRRQAWLLGEDGRYTPASPDGAGDGVETMGTHAYLMEMAGRSQK
jgi:polyphosphate kinase